MVAKRKRRRGPYQLDQYIARRDARDESRRELEAKANPPRPAPHRPDTSVRVSYTDPTQVPTPTSWGPGDYAAYMQSATWRRRKLRYFARHPKKCQVCRLGLKDGEEIHLHHLDYKLTGDEPDEDLMPLCQVHHDAVHARHRRSGGPLRDVTLKYVAQEAEKVARQRLHGKKQR